MKNNIKKIPFLLPLIVIIPFFAFVTDGYNYNYSFFSLCFLSVLLFCLAIYSIYLNKNSQNIQTIKAGFLLPILLLFLSIWILRFNVDLHIALTGESDLSLFEHIFNSMVHALQSFSMDEDYTGYITAGKDYIFNMPYSAGSTSQLSSLYGGYCAVLNLIAPITGGAILFDILTNIFPYIRLYLKLYFRPETYSHVFSELNNQSMALAKSIYESRPKDRIVFTDAYVSDSEEKSYELILEAKQIGAICLRSDLSILKRLSWGPLSYYLLDEDDYGNIEALATLSDNNISALNKTSFFDTWQKKNSYVDIYVFADSSLTDQLIQDFNMKCVEAGIFRGQVDTDEEKGNSTKEKGVVAKAINMSEVLSYDILNKYPLYYSLNESKDSSIEMINILLIGDSPLIRHFIKAAYWCGQMLNPYVEDSKEPKRIYPHFHVLCEDKDDLTKYIKTEMPELYKELESPNPCITYAKLEIEEVHLDRNSIQNAIRQIGRIDYCVISNENDLDNIQLCNFTKNVMNQHSLIYPNTCYILCKVENGSLNDITEQLDQKSGNAKGKLKVHYIGNINEMYQIEAIEKSDLEEQAKWIHFAYKTNVTSAEEVYKELYNYRSSIASALHYQYRLFSAGVFKDDCKDYSYSFKEDDSSRAFLQKLIGIDFSEEQKYSNTKEWSGLIDNIMWLEKIRWNCFTKAQGYMVPLLSEARSFYKNTGGFRFHKNDRGYELMLHGCLMDVTEPHGIVLNDVSKEERERLHRIILEAFEKGAKDPDSFNADTSLEDFLIYILNNQYKDWEYPFDVLDVYSLLVGGDYKDYDLVQIPTMSINQILRISDDSERDGLKKVIVAYLEKMVESEAYLNPQFKEVLDTINKI